MAVRNPSDRNHGAGQLGQVIGRLATLHVRLHQSLQLARPSQYGSTCDDPCFQGCGQDLVTLVPQLSQTVLPAPLVLLPERLSCLAPVGLRHVHQLRQRVGLHVAELVV